MFFGRNKFFKENFFLREQHIAGIFFLHQTDEKQLIRDYDEERTDHPFMVKSRYSILFPTSFFVTLLGNSKCVKSFPNRDGWRWAWREENQHQFLHIPARQQPMKMKSFLTRNWSLWRSDSGVNALDMGMISPPRMTRALKHINISFIKHRHHVNERRSDVSPAVSGIGHIELSQ